MEKVYLVFERQILNNNQWRDEVQCVCVSAETAKQICDENVNWWFSEYSIQF